MADLGAEYFDGWYSDMSHSPTQQRIQQDALGLPARLQSSSLLSWAGLGEVVDLLGVGPGDSLLDVACGRGGYGLEAAARTGARLIGVDFSAVAIAHADRNSAAFELRGPARFVVGELAATGLPDHSVDAVMCVDAIQFATPFRSAAREFQRVVRPGGRIVLTCWQPVDRGDVAVPARLRDLDPQSDLAVAGFTDVVVTDRPAGMRRNGSCGAPPSRSAHPMTRPSPACSPRPDACSNSSTRSAGSSSRRSHLVGHGSRLFEPAAMTV